jgi:hypothetical protein
LTKLSVSPADDGPIRFQGARVIAPGADLDYASEIGWHNCLTVIYRRFKRAPANNGLIGLDRTVVQMTGAYLCD